MVDEGLMIRIPAKLFSQTDYFVLDSGSTTTVLDKSLLNELGSPQSQVTAETPNQPELATNFYNAPDISVGGTSLGLNKIVCIDLSMAQMISGEPCSGVLGMDVLSKFVVTMDFEKNRFLLSHDVQPEINLDANPIPLIPIGDNRFGVNAVLNGSQNFTLMIDSGASVSVSLNKHDWNELFGNNAETVGRISYFTGAGNSVQKNRIARLDTLRIGTTLYTNLLCAQLSNPNSVSHIGLDFLRQNSVVLDFPNKQLHLVKRPGFPQEEDDMSGLHLLWKDNGVVIFAVDVGSPAEIAGLKAGDQIVSINGTPSTEIKLERIRNLLEGGDGKQVDATINRDGKTFVATITLKRFI